MANGLPPSEFWDQSPRSFVSIMDGCTRRAKRESDAMLAHAWHIEAFARQKHLKPLHKLLAIKKPRKAQTPDEMLAVLLQAQAGGAPLHFSEIN